MKIHAKLAQGIGALQHFQYRVATGTLQNRKKSRNWTRPLGLECPTPLPLCELQHDIYSYCSPPLLCIQPAKQVLCFSDPHPPTHSRVFLACISPHSHSFNYVLWCERESKGVWPLLLLYLLAFLPHSLFCALSSPPSLFAFLPPTVLTSEIR